MLRGRTDLDPADFVRQADTAMYAAKQAGAEVRLFDDVLLTESDEKRDLRRALPRDQRRRTRRPPPADRRPDEPSSHRL